MRIVKVDGRSAYINVGSATGIKVGDKFTIYRPGEALIDPVTGMNLGSTEKQVGTLVVTEVQENILDRDGHRRCRRQRHRQAVGRSRRARPGAALVLEHDGSRVC